MSVGNFCTHIHSEIWVVPKQRNKSKVLPYCIPSSANEVSLQYNQASSFQAVAHKVWTNTAAGSKHFVMHTMLRRACRKMSNLTITLSDHIAQLVEEVILCTSSITKAQKQVLGSRAADQCERSDKEALAGASTTRWIIRSV